MKHYTDTIPLDLAEKLKAKGMPMMTSVSISIVEDKPVIDENGEQWYRPSYAEVFDWLMEKGIVMEQTRLFGNYHIRPIVFIEDGEQMPIKDFCKSHSWHEAANAAIEKALTLI